MYFQLVHLGLILAFYNSSAHLFCETVKNKEVNLMSLFRH